MEWEIIHIAETDSTNRWLRDNSLRLADDSHGASLSGVLVGERPTVVWTDYQTAGRGCGTNTWESERGRNLLFSMLIHPDGLRANEQFRITEWVSVALCETLERYVGRAVDIKWPNDIYVDGRKICGILTENRLHGGQIRDSIIGIGLNVNQQTFVSDAPNPVSLVQLTGQETDREALLADFLRSFEAVSARQAVGQDYRRRLFVRDNLATYSDQAGMFRATIRDVEADGHLVLVDETGQERRYAFKEVRLMV